MRVLFVGLGSIGKRHLNNLIHIAARRGISLDRWMHCGPV